MAAEEGGEQLVEVHHVGGGGLPHAGQAKGAAHYQGFRRPPQGPGDEHGNVGDGDGDGLDVKVAQKGEGHQKLHGHHGGQEQPVDRRHGLAQFPAHGKASFPAAGPSRPLAALV